jgi:hypothetical protein
VPFTWTTEEARKFSPVTVTVVAVVAPVVTVAGEILVTNGTGLFTGSDAAGDEPPPGAAFTATMDRLPPVARSAAVRITFTEVEFTKVVSRAVPPT